MAKITALYYSMQEGGIHGSTVLLYPATANRICLSYFSLNWSNHYLLMPKYGWICGTE